MAIVVIVALVLAGVIALVVGDHRPRTTEGVQKIDGQTAIFAQSETLVLTSKCGKHCTDTWVITWDGEHAVTMDSYDKDNDRAITLCGVDCTVTEDFGWWTYVDFTLQSDRTIKVHWPWNWGYREYQAEEKK